MQMCSADMMLVLKPRCALLLQAYDTNLEGQRASLQELTVKKIEDFKASVAGFASRLVTD